jgi:hypothetical protein
MQKSKLKSMDSHYSWGIPMSNQNPNPGQTCLPEDEPLFWSGLVFEFQSFGKYGYVYYNTFINDVEPQSNQLVFKILTKEIILTETHDKSNAKSRRMWKFIPMLDTVFEKLKGRLILTVRESASEDGSNL